MKRELRGNKKRILLVSFVLIIISLFSWVVYAGGGWVPGEAFHQPLFTQEILYYDSVTCYNADGTIDDTCTTSGLGGTITVGDSLVVIGSVGIGAVDPTLGAGIDINGETSADLPGITLHLRETTDSGNILIEGKTRGQILLSDIDATADERMFALKSESGLATLYSLLDSNLNTNVDNIMVWNLGTGNVGIGTTSTSEKLTVAGNIKITGTGNGIKFSDDTIQTTAIGGMWETIVATNDIDYSSGNVYVGSNAYTASGIVVSSPSEPSGVTECDQCTNDDLLDCASLPATERHFGTDSICYDWDDVANEYQLYVKGAHLLIPGPEGKIGIGTSNPETELTINRYPDGLPSTTKYTYTGRRTCGTWYNVTLPTAVKTEGFKGMATKAMIDFADRYSGILTVASTRSIITKWPESMSVAVTTRGGSNQNIIQEVVTHNLRYSLYNCVAYIGTDSNTPSVDIEIDYITI